MFNMNNKKTRKIMSTIIIIFVVVAMLIGPIAMALM